MSEKIHASRIDAELANLLAKYFGEKLSQRKPTRPGAGTSTGCTDGQGESHGNAGAANADEQAQQERR